MKAVWKKIRKTNDLRSKHVWNGLDTGYWMICPRVCHQRKSRQSEWFVIRCFHVHVADSLYLSLRCSCCCVGLAKFKLLCWGIRDVGEHMRLQCAIYLPTPSVIMALFLRSSKLIYKIPVGLPIGVYRLNLNWGQDPLSSKKKISKATTLPPRFCVLPLTFTTVCTTPNKCEANTVFTNSCF